jgi:DNA-directed RNA polymerase specialized sigma24 family protein
MQGLVRFSKIITGQMVLGNLPIDIEESEILAVLNELESFDIHVFEKANSSVQRMRANIRYLTALWPDASMTELGQRIHALINNRNLDFADVMTVLRGERLSETAQLQDLRVVLSGGKLHNTQEKTNEVPVPVLQGVGRCLRDGISMAETARVMHISIDTVRAVENLLGLRSAYLNNLTDAAVQAVRDGLSIRVFAAKHNVSKGKAESLLAQGRSVLQELGEAQ